MDADVALKILRAGFKRGTRVDPSPRTDLDERAAHAFWSWLQEHRVSVAGLVRLTGLSRSTLSSLAGGGAAVRWSAVTASTVDRLLPVMRYVQPDLTRDSLRRLLGLPESDAWSESSTTPTTWLVNVPLALEDALQVHLVVDVDSPLPPHVYRLGGHAGETVITTQMQPDGLRLGRLVSITPA